MKKKSFIYRETDTAENKINFNTDPGNNKKWDVKVFDRNGNQVKEYDYIQPDGKVVITLKFQWESKFSEVSERDIEYLLERTDYWEPINNGEKPKVKAGKKPEFNKLVKEAHKKLLKDHFKNELFSVDKKEPLPDSESVDFNITEDKGIITVNLYRRGDTSGTPRSFREDQIHINPIYYSTKEASYEEASEIDEEDEEKSQLTTGWKVFFVVLAIAAMLIVIFWKKIWKWFKGEREQERKVREQLDIF
jgi:hypothetical protein